MGKRLAWMFPILVTGLGCGPGDAAMTDLQVQGAGASARGPEPAPAPPREPEMDPAVLGPIEDGERLPTGARITPAAAPGSIFSGLNPDLPERPEFLVDHAVSSAVSPDGTELYILTSGYNRNNDAAGKYIPAQSKEYLFVYDISAHPPAKRQVLSVANSFVGLAVSPDGAQLYVAGGVDDVVHVFQRGEGSWAEVSPAIPLHHAAGVGPGMKPAAAGLAVSADGATLVVANYENDSVSLVDLSTRAVTDVELRPGKAAGGPTGVAGGTYPYGVAIVGNQKAYVSSQRDRELVVVRLTPRPAVLRRIPVGGQPNNLILNAGQTRLFVANANSDSVSVIDTAKDQVIEEIGTVAPRAVFENPRGWKGANPDGLALAADGRVLLVTNGGTNALALIGLSGEAAGLDDRPPAGDDAEDDEDQGNASPAGKKRSQVLGLIPTGWYPNAVSLGADGWFYVVNGKANAGPGCIDVVGSDRKYVGCGKGNQYIWQLEKAGFLAAPLPSGRELARLTRQVAANNLFPNVERHWRHEETMRFLRQRIKHVVYIIKENRTYDQVLGDLPAGNGDPSLTMFPQPVTPNHHALASQFVTLDGFLDSGETSGVGWNWTTAARTTDSVEKTQPVNYAGRGLAYDWEGTNRNINVGLATVGERLAANPLTPPDPDLLPGTADVAAPDAAGEHAPGTGYLWDAALRKGLSVRNYGVFGDLARYFLPASSPAFIPPVREPFKDNVRQFFAAKASLQSVSDPYFRGYDNAYPDFWRVQEWAREFDGYVAGANLPALSLVRLPHDHFGSFAAAIDGVNTPETQMADNDYAIGLVVQKVAASPYRDSTLVFIIEDDAQDGPDHVDGHRSIAFVAGPYVKPGAVVSAPYNTVAMVRTIEDVLGLDPLGLTDGLADPMTDVFDTALDPASFSYTAQVPEVLRTTKLPLPAPAVALAAAAPRHDSRYWERVSAGQVFTREDAVETATFNRVLWRGVLGNRPYPVVRNGRDLSRDRAGLLAGSRR